MSDDSGDERDIRLGSLALRSKWVTPEGLRKVLALQAEEALAGRAAPIGELLLREKLLTRDQLQRLLTQQESLRRQAGP
jgi:hypothetical protein